jgi:hypothetical protein
MAGTLAFTPATARNMPKYRTDGLWWNPIMGKPIMLTSEFIWIMRALLWYRSPSQDPANMYRAARRYGGVPRHWAWTMLKFKLCCRTIGRKNAKEYDTVVDRLSLSAVSKTVVSVGIACYLQEEKGKDPNLKVSGWRHKSLPLERFGIDITAVGFKATNNSLHFIWLEEKEAGLGHFFVRKLDY